MKIMISPAKKMNRKPEVLAYKDLPQFIDSTQLIVQALQSRNLFELQNLWKCNDKIALQNYERIQEMNLGEHLTPALLAYEGIQYQYMAPTVFEGAMLDYVQKHLRILSGFYGILRPMDGVVPYRLEMQTKLSMDKYKNLYEYWGRTLYESMREDDGTQVIVNLASKEYATCIERYLKPEDQFITCVFGEVVNHKVVQKGTYAKMARGEMVRYMADKQIHNIEEMKAFNRLGYSYSEEDSTATNWVFIKRDSRSWKKEV